MQRAPLAAIIILTGVGAGAAAWWASTADDRRVSECHDVGIQDQSRLARCARGSEARDAVLAEVREERKLELRRRVRVRLAEIRPTQVDKSQYEHLSIGELQAKGLDPYRVMYDRAEVPARIEGQRIAINGVDLDTDLERYGFNLVGRLSEKADQKLFNIAADIEDLNRGEREFIRTVCADYFLIYAGTGCPVMVYGQIAFKSVFEDNWLDPWLDEDGSLLTPVFRIEAVEFQDFPGEKSRLPQEHHKNPSR